MRFSQGIKLTVFALTPTAVVLVALEVSLWALGFGAREENVWRGFDPEARYLVPADDGGFLTQMFEGELSEIEIPPRSELTRVLLFGGSNTQSFHVKALRTFLDLRRPEGAPGFEVINLGRHGYGSGRVSILLEQAMELEPDVVVIYTGHNEFIEAGFEEVIRDEWGGWTGSAAEVASGLRTFNALVAGFGGEDEGFHTKEARPEDWSWDAARFRELTYDRTLDRLEQYRDNLRHMCRTALDHGATVLLCTLVGNDMAAPFSSTLSPELPPERAAEVEELGARALELMPRFLHRIVSERQSLRLRNSDWWRRREAPRELSEGFAAPELREHRAPLGDRAWWPPPEQWGSKIDVFLADLADFHQRRIDDDEIRDLEAARSTLERILALAPDHPITLFRLGLVTWLLEGDGARTSELLRRAARHDRAPRKTSDLTNELVREVAEELPEVILCDLAALYRERSPDGIVGFELMSDHCHFHEALYKPLMGDLGAELLANPR
ncbi:MAG: hypothetical protein O7B99_11355 [Planctomycetota bacterium]|nr:hypothetical protein [Planctomycetota bacterium]